MDLHRFAPIDVLACFAVIVDKDRPLHFLGEGGQARVYGFHDGRLNPQTGRPIGPVAVKCYPREVLRALDIKGKRVLREIMNHRRLCHKHIVGFREVRLTQDYLVLALDYIQGGTLWQKLNKIGIPLSEESARWCFQQLMLAVDYLHRRNIANRDISLENILVNESSNDVSVLLCDFGLSRSKISLENNGTRSIVGKNGYIAPEVLIRMDRKSFTLATAGDIYSCGVCLYKMLLGIDERPLFISDSLDPPSLQDVVVKLVCATEEPSLTIDSGHNISPECVSFLKKILHTNPKQRITMDEIWNDSWFTTNLPENATRAYNDLVCSKKYMDENFSCLQSEPELQNKVQKACSDYRVPSVWE
eukprot:g1018.t1